MTTVKSNTTFLGEMEFDETAQEKANAKVMVDVDHVSMIFNIASEQLNSLKEYAIALSRRELRFKEFRALDDVSFQVNQGDVFGILGTNGSGKSTVLKVIAGVLEPSKGKCTVNGNIAPLIELGAGFDMELTARENIFLNGALLGYSKTYIQDHFDEIVEFAEVADFLDMPMKNYSSGMVARIAFAIATVIIPDILIVDEALSVGDFMFQQKCERRIRALIDDYGVTVLIVSHSNEQIERLCNKAVWIEKGHVRTVGPAKKVCEIYRLVGGRTGSIDSEKYILDLVERELPPMDISHTCLFGDDRYSSAIQANDHANAAKNIIILTNNDDERSNRIASSLAAALNASLLTTRIDHLPSVTEQEIKHSKPGKILLIGGVDLINETVEQELLECTSAKIDRIEDSKLNGIEAYRFAKNNGAQWGETAIVASEKAHVAMAALSPYAYMLNAPVFYAPEPNGTTDDLQSILDNFSRVIDLSNNVRALVPSDTAIISFASKDPETTNLEINDWILEDCVKQNIRKPYSLVITAPDNEIDNHIVGPLAGRCSALLLYADPRNLDSMASAMKYIGSYYTPRCELIYLGGELRFNRQTRALFDRAILAKNK